MNDFLRIFAGVLLTVIVGIVLNKQGKELGVLLSIAVCAMVFALAANYLQPVVSFVSKLQDTSGVDKEMFSAIWKAVGVCFLTELAVTVCQDAGNASLAKSVQFLGSVVVLWLSLPLMEALLELIQKIMGEA